MIPLNQPLISVILASYNHHNYIREAIESVLCQQGVNLELLVLDDGSTDGTPDVIGEIHDRRLRLFRLTPNRQYHPRNMGIQKARGAFIAFQNSDDVWLPSKLSQQVEVLRQRKEVVACFTRPIIIDESDKTIQKSWTHANLAKANQNNDAWLRQLFTCGINFGISSALVRKKAITSVGGFNPSLVQMGDCDLWVRLLGLGQLNIIDQPLTKLRVVKGQNASTPSREVERRSNLEYAAILQRFTQWPVNQYLKNIFPDIIPSGLTSTRLQHATLAQYAWDLGMPYHYLFADRVLSNLFEDNRSRNEILAYFGTEIFHQFIKHRAELELKVYKK